MYLIANRGFVKKSFCLLNMLCFSSIAVAEPESNDTIKVIVPSNAEKTGYYLWLQPEGTQKLGDKPQFFASAFQNKVSNIPIKEIKDTIAKVKGTVCEAVKPGTVKVWFSFDAEGKILGIGSSAQGGIEVTFECK